MLNGESAESPGQLTQHLLGAPAEAQEKIEVTACMREKKRQEDNLSQKKI